jgi:hypothetical protein
MGVRVRHNKSLNRRHFENSVSERAKRRVTMHGTERTSLHAPKQVNLHEESLSSFSKRERTEHDETDEIIPVSFMRKALKTVNYLLARMTLE